MPRSPIRPAPTLHAARAALIPLLLWLAPACEDDEGTPPDGTDADPPVVALTSPANGASLGCATVAVSGTATDASGVASVTVNGVAATDTGNGFSTWEATVTLAPGDNAIDVSAEDTVGNASTPATLAHVEIVDASALSLDVSSGRLYGTVTLDGTDLYSPEHTYQATLRDPVSGWTARIGYYATSPNWQIPTIQGTYDLLFELEDELIGDASVLDLPVVVGTALTVGADTRYDVALERATITGAVTVDGGPPQGSGAAGFSVGLAEPGASARDFVSVPGGETSYTIRTLAGTYDVWFTFPYGYFDPSSPEMRLVAARSVHVTPTTSLPIDVRTVAVLGSLSVDGGTLHGGYLSFDEVETGQSFTFPVSGSSYAVRVPEGRYDVTLTTQEEVLGGDPFSEYHPVGLLPLAQDEALAGSARFDVVLETAAVSGTLTLDGGTLPQPPKSWLTMQFEDPATGARVQADFRSNGGFFSMNVFTGTYDVWATLPASSLDGDLHEALRPVLVEEGLDVGPGGAQVSGDIVSAEVSGSVTLGGEPLVSSPDRYWRLHLASVDDPSRASVTTFTDTSGAYSMRAYPGAYEARIELDEFLVGADLGALVLPRPAGVLDLGATGTTFDVDFAPATLGGTVSLDGVPIAGNPSWEFTVGITDPEVTTDPDEGGSLSFFADQPDFTAPTLAGTYDVWLTLPPEVLGGGAASLPVRVREGLVLCAP